MTTNRLSLNLLAEQFSSFTRTFCASRVHYSIFFRAIAACLILSEACSADEGLRSTTSGRDDFSIEFECTKTSSAPADVDVFVFNDDLLQRLDTYQRCRTNEDNTAKIASTPGDRIIVAIADPDADKFSWAAMNSLDALKSRSSLFRNEDPDAPVMSGCARVKGKEKNSCLMTLTPLLSKVCLRSISCDFTGRPYSGEKLENAKVYLTNVPAGCGYLDDEVFIPEEILNERRLRSEDIASLKHPQMLFANLPSPIGWDVLQTDVTLYTYPNTVIEESSGSPFTRIVIEGRIAGKTWYYPININRGADTDGVAGVGRNCTYVYDVTILRTGSDDPDTPVTSNMVKLNCRIIPWEEKGENVELF